MPIYQQFVFAGVSAFNYSESPPNTKTSLPTSVFPVSYKIIFIFIFSTAYQGADWCETESEDCCYETQERQSPIDLTGATELVK